MISVHVSMSEDVQAIQKLCVTYLREGGSLLSKRMQLVIADHGLPVNVVAEVSDGFLRQLRSKGFEVVDDLYREAENIVLDKEITDIHIGPGTATKAGRPVMAEYRKRKLSEPTDLSGYALWFLDENGKKVASVLDGGLVVSKHARFVSLEGFLSSMEATEVPFSVYSNTGKRVYEMRLPWMYDEDPNDLGPSDSGNWIEDALEHEKRVSFFAPDGKKQGEVTFSVEPRIDLSSDGQFLLAQFVKSANDSATRNEVTIMAQAGLGRARLFWLSLLFSAWSWLRVWGHADSCIPLGC